MLLPQKHLKIPHISLLIHHGKFHLCYGHINRKYPHQDFLSFPSICSCNFPLCIAVLTPQALLQHAYSPFSQLTLASHCPLLDLSHNSSISFMYKHFRLFFPHNVFHQLTSLNSTTSPFLSPGCVFSTNFYHATV